MCILIAILIKLMGGGPARPPPVAIRVKSPIALCRLRRFGCWSYEISKYELSLVYLKEHLAGDRNIFPICLFLVTLESDWNKPKADAYLFLTRSITISKLIMKSRIFTLLRESVEKSPGISTREKKLSWKKDLANSMQSKLLLPLRSVTFNLKGPQEKQ